MSLFDQTLLVFAHESRRHLRSAKSLVLLLLYGLSATLSGLVFVASTRKLQGELDRLTGGAPLPPGALTELKMGGLAFFFGQDEATLRHLVELPLVVVFFFKSALFFLPPLIVLMGFDQLSGELQCRSLRFTAQRASRASLLLGKVLAQGAVLLALTALIDLVLFGWAAATTEGFAMGRGLSAMTLFWALAAVQGFAYLGLTALASALFAAPSLSLLTCCAALFGFWILSLLGRFGGPTLQKLGWLAPSRYEAGLFSPDPLTVLFSVGAFALFAALFLGLAHQVLARREL